MTTEIMIDRIYVWQKIEKKVKVAEAATKPSAGHKNNLIQPTITL